MFRASGSAALCVTLTFEVGTLGSGLIFLLFDGNKVLKREETAEQGVL